MDFTEIIPAKPTTPPNSGTPSFDYTYTCLAGRNTKESSNGKTTEKLDEACYREALQAFIRQYQPRLCDATEFHAEKDLIFSPPKPEHAWTLADLELPKDISMASFAVSGNFPLFSADTITKMRGELLNDTVQQKFGRSSSITDRQLRGMVPEYVGFPKMRAGLMGRPESYARFTYNAWNHAETLAAISKVVGIDLVPVMDMEISHVNIATSTDGHVKWHRDDYPYVCVLMLSDTTQMIGGDVLLRTGSGATLFCEPPKMGSAYIIHGRYIEHSVSSFKGCPKRITAATSFRPRTPLE